MTALSIILDIVLILISLVLIAAVLMQQGQRQGLGAIAGGAETFFGKNKSRGLDGKLQKITKIAAVVFIVLAIVTTIVVAHNASSSAAVTDVNAAVQEILNDVAESETAETETAAEGETAADAEPADAEPAADAEAEADTAAN
ncbi:MAG: preprotein translocase subunit SecG [Eubacteriales bacterium]|nr:preprotein translocase subunit SecG [Eubacteriales bacterium]